MPDVEMLSLLSKEFGVSINELISGERLWAEDFKKAADNNLVTALNNSTFTRQVWYKSHRVGILRFLSFGTWLCIVRIARPAFSFHSSVQRYVLFV